MATPSLPPLLLLLVVVAAAATQAARAPACSTIATRVRCAPPTAYSTEERCLARGCCFDTSVSPTNATAPACFYAAEGKAVTRVHLVQSNHFDAGYGDLMINIVNDYFDKYFPLAYTVGKACNGTDHELKWMTQAWLVSLFLSCPEGLGLHCPDATAQANLRTAMSSGWVTYHAFPHNAHLETARAGMIAAGVDLVHALDDDLGQKRKHVLSQRDVPGIPRSVLPILAAKGVDAVSIGANGRMIAPNFPPVSIWRNELGAAPIDMLTFLHEEGYGRIGEPLDYARLPNFGEVLMYAWRSDNAGPPPSVLDVQADYAAARKLFPGAEVIASSFDAFVEAIKAGGSDALTGLSTITADSGNTWNMGDMQDPLKAAESRAIDRVHDGCLASGCGTTAEQLARFQQLTVKNCEHTFGISIGRFGRYSTKRWSNADFEADLATYDKEFNVTEQSWVEQREVGIDAPLRAVEGTQLHALCQAEFDKIRAAAIPPAVTGAGWKPVSLSAPITAGDYELTFSPTTGVLTELSIPSRKFKAAGAFGGFMYQTMNDADFASLYRAQFLIPGTGGQNEYGKENCDVSISESKLWAPASVKAFQLGATVAVQVAFPPAAVTDYGCPQEAWVTFTANGTLDVVVAAVNKSATRLPEALYFPFAADDSAYSLEVHGQWTAALNDTVQAGGRGQRGITDFVRADLPAQGGRITLQSLDTGLLRIGPPTGPFPDPATAQPDVSAGTHFVLAANPWSTNFPYWAPATKDPESIMAGRPMASYGWRFSLQVEN